MIFNDVGIVPFKFACFDVDQVKLRLQCQNIFSAARHLQFGNLRARSDWAMEILLCSLIPYPRQRKQRKPNIIQPGVEYNGRRNGHVNATNTPRTFLCTLWVFGAHIGFVLRPMKWSESHRDESVSHKLWSKVITLAQNAPARLNQMFVV